MRGGEAEQKPEALLGGVVVTALFTRVSLWVISVGAWMIDDVVNSERVVIIAQHCLVFHFFTVAIVFITENIK